MYELFSIEGGIGIRVPREFLPFLSARHEEVQASSWIIGTTLLGAPSQDPHQQTWHFRFPAPISKPGDLNVNHALLEQASRTWQLVFESLDAFAHERPALDPPLFRVGLGLTGGSFHGAPIWAYVLPKIRRWIHPLGDLTIPEVERAMFDAWRAMMPQEEGDEDCGMEREFGAWTNRPNRIHLHTFGNCACLDSGGETFDEDEPIELQSHNVDTPLQQITLLAGLAAFSDVLRRDRAVFLS